MKELSKRDKKLLIFSELKKHHKAILPEDANSFSTNQTYLTDNTYHLNKLNRDFSMKEVGNIFKTVPPLIITQGLLLCWGISCLKSSLQNTEGFALLQSTLSLNLMAAIPMIGGYVALAKRAALHLQRRVIKHKISKDAKKWLRQKQNELDTECRQKTEVIHQIFLHEGQSVSNDDPRPTNRVLSNGMVRFDLTLPPLPPDITTSCKPAVFLFDTSENSTPKIESAPQPRYFQVDVPQAALNGLSNILIKHYETEDATKFRQAHELGSLLKTLSNITPHRTLGSAPTTISEESPSTPTRVIEQ
jgi:hypothetical protein